MRRPRLLFLAYSFPPVNKVGGVRAFNIAKYLTLFGWEVTVVTPSVSVWRHVEAIEETQRELERRGIRCIRTNHRWPVLSPDDLLAWDRGIGWAVGGMARRASRFLSVEPEIGWVLEVEKACSGLHQDDVDLILASGPPFASFRLARRLSTRLRSPYVLDYRDLWTRNPHRIHRARDAKVKEEERALQECAATLTISRSMLESLCANFSIDGKVQVVTNGYDPDSLVDVRPLDFGHFAIVYTGVFYAPKRVITPVMAAIHRLKSRPVRREWVFHYYGAHANHVLEEARRFDIEDKVILHGRVSRREALSAVRGASIAVVITSVAREASLEDRGIITGKVFDAIGVGTPLLAIAPDGSDLDGVLAATGLGKRFAGTEIDRIAGFLQDRINGGAPPVLNPGQFSWVNIAPQLDGILREVLAAKRPSPGMSVA